MCKTRTNYLARAKGIFIILYRKISIMSTVLYYLKILKLMFSRSELKRIFGDMPDFI